MKPIFMTAKLPAKSIPLKSMIALSVCGMLLTGCGGGGSDSLIQTPPALDNAPGGQYFGFYAESNEVSDPDPAVGGLYLDIPNSEGNVKGRMSFQYEYCQRSNALQINAQKLTRYISAGLATGTIDAVSTDQVDNSVVFNFGGDYSRNSQNYNGSYDRGNRSNDKHNIPDCISYTIARKGNWSVYPSTTVFPNGFSFNQAGFVIYWSGQPASASKALLNIIDPSAVGTTSDNGFVLQRSISPIVNQSIALPNNIWQAGKEYIVLLQLFDNQNKIVAFKQSRIVF